MQDMQRSCAPTASLECCRYGQARRKGRMLVAKLDYLQYIAVTSVSNILGARLKAWWRDRVGSSKANPLREERKYENQEDQIELQDKTVNPVDGRMPNAAGESAPRLTITKIHVVFCECQGLDEAEKDHTHLACSALLHQSPKPCSDAGVCIRQYNWTLSPPCCKGMRESPSPRLITATYWVAQP